MINPSPVGFSLVGPARRTLFPKLSASHPPPNWVHLVDDG